MPLYRPARARVIGVLRAPPGVPGLARRWARPLASCRSHAGGAWFWRTCQRGPPPHEMTALARPGLGGGAEERWGGCGGGGGAGAPAGVLPIARRARMVLAPLPARAAAA